MEDCKEEGESSSSSSNNSKWSHIEYDVFKCILQRLCLSDYLRIQAVCSRWRAIVAEAVEEKLCPPSPELPLLLLRPSYRLSDQFFFFSLSTQRLFKFVNTQTSPQDLLRNQTCYGTVQGWAIMSETYYNFDSTVSRSIFFFNPVTNARVYVPARLNCPTPIRKIVASSNPRDPHCVVVCLFKGYGNMAFWRIRDKSWTLIEGNKDIGLTFMEAEILDAKLYVFSRRSLNSILVYDLREKNPTEPTILARLPAVRPAPIITTVGNIHYNYNNDLSFLAVDASRGELLLIYALSNLVFVRDDVNNMGVVEPRMSLPKITAFQVFKWENEGWWMEVHTLGDRLLFVGAMKSFVVSSVDLNGPAKLVILAL